MLWLIGEELFAQESTTGWPEPGAAGAERPGGLWLAARLFRVNTLLSGQLPGRKELVQLLVWEKTKLFLSYVPVRPP